MQFFQSMSLVKKAEKIDKVRREKKRVQKIVRWRGGGVFSIIKNGIEAHRLKNPLCSFALISRNS